MSFQAYDYEDEEHESADINVTPLVDVMLVLLIVFMVTMPVLTHSLPLTLPTAVASQQVETREPIRLSIAEDGRYAIGEDGANLDDIKQRFKQIAQQDPDTVVAIAADKNVAYNHVAQVLSAARLAGLTKVGFVTEDE